MKRILGPQGTIRSHGGNALLALLVGALANGMSGNALAAEPTSSAAQRASIDDASATLRKARQSVPVAFGRRAHDDGRD